MRWHQILQLVVCYPSRPTAQRKLHRDWFGAAPRAALPRSEFCLAEPYKLHSVHDFCCLAALFGLRSTTPLELVGREFGRLGSIRRKGIVGQGEAVALRR